MSGKFNVFDEWGNKVGEYTPTGGSGADGLIMIVALTFLWIIGFLVYTFFRLIGQGIKEASLGNWSKAVGYFAIPVVLTIAMLINLFVTVVVAPKVQAQQFQQADQKAREDARALLEDQLVKIEIIRENHLLVVSVENGWKNPIEFSYQVQGTTSTGNFAYKCIPTLQQYHRPTDQVDMDIANAKPFVTFAS